MSALRRLAARLVWMVPFAALISTACEHNPGEVGFPLFNITVTRNPDTLAVGTTAQFYATGTDANGKVMGINPTWSVAAGGGTVNSSGVFTAGTAPGPFANTVKATVGGVSGTATVIVTTGALAKVTVTPSPDTLAIGGGQTFTAKGWDAYNNQISGLTFTWAVANATAGAINSTSGAFTAGTVAGTYPNTVTASVGSISGAASVTVNAGAVSKITVSPTPVTLGTGGTQQFTAVVQDANNNILPNLPTWSVVNATAGTINGTSGAFTAGTVAGTYPNTVKASVGSISGTASVTVSAGVAAKIIVVPTPVSLAIGSTQQFTDTVKDANNNILPISVDWVVEAGGGTIDAAGLFTAGTTAGTFTNTVVASIGTVEGAATVTVNAGALASIAVTPNPVSLPLGATQTFTAVGKDANGNILSIAPTWSVLAGGGSINSSALFKAGTVAGTFTSTVTATSGSVVGHATVVVVAGALATITVTPNPVNVGTLASQQFTAVGKDASGNIIPILPLPVWTVVAGGANGTVSSGTGFYTAPSGVGVDHVRATDTSTAIFGSATVNVTPSGLLVSIVVTPNPANVDSGGTVQFVATGFDGTGLVVPIGAGLTWSVVDATAGSINSAGLFTTGTALGTFPNAVKATDGGSISSYATVIVNAPPPSFLGAAATHGILAGSAVSCAGAPGTINADVSVWPGSAISGFPPCTISGVRNAADPYAQTAQGDLTTAYNELAAMACGTTITADIGNTTLAEGVYCSTSSVGVTGTLTLTGNANSIFVIRAASTLTTAGNVVMAGGALAKNVYWWVGSSATLGNGSAIQGSILALQSITLAGNVTLTGRALARNGAVSLNGTGNTITLP